MSDTIAKFPRVLEKRVEALIEAALGEDTELTVRIGDELEKIKGWTVIIRVEEARQVHPRMNLVEGRLNVLLRAKSADADADELNAEWAKVCAVLDAADFAAKVTQANVIHCYGTKIAPFTHEIEDNTFKKRWVKSVSGYVPMPAT